MSTSSFWSGPVRGGGPSAEQAASLAATEAATNLFDKVVEALARGDEGRARQLAAQAARRPFDDHEHVWPGPWAAHFAIFELVTDTIEEWPEEDHGWVGVLADLTAGESGRQLDELKHLAAVLRQDARLLGVHQEEAAALRELADGSDPAVAPHELVPERERADYVLDLARLLLRLEEQFDDFWAGVPSAATSTGPAERPTT